MGDTTTLRLYNTLTRKKEDFVPIDPANLRMYVCGPTVYDFAHIGNARPVIVFDLLFRLLRHLYGPEHVTYVRNITDVDDKINARAARDFPGLPLNEAIRKVTETTAAQYHKDVAALGALEPTVEPRATDNIPQMVELIQVLLDKGHAYVAHGKEGREALFDVTSMPEYGELSRREASAKLAGARIERKDHKRNPEDFVLWKESDPAEPGWDAEFVVSEENRAELHLNRKTVKIRGRPGWHIECSAMSERYLWTEIEARLSPAAHSHEHAHTFDIHAGGLDLIFPHHENEIAQSRCAHGTEVMANYWLHNGFLQVEGQKMSKSLGNFITIHELLETEKFGGRKWPGEVLRLAMLMTHYREPIDFSVKRLEEAERMWLRWGRVQHQLSGNDWQALNSVLSTPQPHAGVLRFLVDDLSISGVIATMQSLAKSAEAGNDRSGLLLASTAAFLGIDLTNAQIEVDVSAVEAAIVADQISARLAALNAKDFAKADTIRAELLAQGVQLMDYKDEAGQRQTKWEVKR